METLHPEGGESPFVVQDDASIAALMALDDNEQDDQKYASCPVEGCGEALLLTDLESHIEMHQEEQGTSGESSRSPKRLKLGPGSESTFDTKLSYALRNLDEGDEGKQLQPVDAPPSDRQATAKAAWKGLLKMPEASKISHGSPTKTPASKGSRRRLGVRYLSWS